MGISVTTAIFIHEIAHQIGDFSLLMSRNFTLFQAFLLQILTSVTAFSGGYFFFIPYFREKFQSFEQYSSCFVAGGFFY
jgi:zinc and cadmium transporter